MNEPVPARRFSSGHAIAFAVWVAALGAVYRFFDAALQPKVATVASADAGRGEVTIQRSRDGHYYVAGRINGHAVTFLVDTGASAVAVSERFARQAGLPRGQPIRLYTAGGSTAGESVGNQTVDVAGLRVDGLSVTVGIAPSTPEIALLGQNFLRRVEVVQVADTLRLRLPTGR